MDLFQRHNTAGLDEIQLVVKDAGDLPRHGNGESPKKMMTISDYKRGLGCLRGQANYTSNWTRELESPCWLAIEMT
jgi:hypothetical protein